ncbi:MAG: lysylphosphatidylglycerol synthase transmembrane domain-containing protein [bacterium]
MLAPEVKDNGQRRQDNTWKQDWVIKVVQCLVTTVLLWWLLHNPERRADMGAAIMRADPLWLLAAILSAGACEFFGIIRWQLFLKMLHMRVPLTETTRLFFIGAFFNQFLPGTTGGDVVRVLYLMKEHPEDRTAGLLSVAIDRLLAMLVLVAMGLGFAWCRAEWFARSAAVGGAMKVFAVVLFTMAVGLAASFVLTKRQLIERLPSRVPFRATIVKLSTLWQLCIENRRDALLGALYTVPMLVSFFAAFYFVARAFTPSVHFWDMMSIMPLVTAVSSIPISLNGIGVREVLLDELLYELCGVAKGTGMLVSITGMVVYLLWGLPGGWFYLSRRRQERVSSR